MANSRIARFVMEVAPPQIISVMRQRTKNMLDTIVEEERDNSYSSSSGFSPSSRSSTSSSPASASASSAVIAAACLQACGSDRYFLTRGRSSFSTFDE